MRVTLPGGGELHVSAGGSVPEAPPKAAKQLHGSEVPTFGRQKGAPLAKGGDTKMAGRGDRTTTAPEDSAGKQAPGSTAHKTASRGSILAEGGKGHLGKQAADPAPPGRTAKPHGAADTKQASGGLSRPARPGECGT